MSSLFRKEAIEAQYRGTDTPLQLYQPLSLRLLALGFGLLVALVIGCAFLVETQRKVTVGGHLVPVGGFVDVGSPAKGVLGKGLPEDGAEVQSGQILSVIVADPSSADVRRAALAEIPDAPKAPVSVKAIRAPVTGTVVGHTASVGSAVLAGTPILTLLPRGAELEAHLFVPGSAAGFIQDGKTVSLRYRAFPFQKFGHYRGRVLRVSPGPISGDELTRLLGHPSESFEPHYRVVVRLQKQSVTVSGREQPLLPGMLVDAEIVLESRSLLEWAFEPLFSPRNRPDNGN